MEDLRTRLVLDGESIIFQIPLFISVGANAGQQYQRLAVLTHHVDEPLSSR